LCARITRGEEKNEENRDHTNAQALYNYVAFQVLDGNRDVGEFSKWMKEVRNRICNL